MMHVLLAGMVDIVLPCIEGGNVCAVAHFESLWPSMAVCDRTAAVLNQTPPSPPCDP